LIYAPFPRQSTAVGRGPGGWVCVPCFFLDTLHERYVDNGREFYNVTIGSTFDTPPDVLVPGEMLTLTVRFTHSGHVDEGNPGAAFQYTADRAHASIFWPQTALSYAPWSPDFDGETAKTWTAEVPAWGHESLEIVAFWWNCAACNITWRYKLE
jgi:hypothetical protein